MSTTSRAEINLANAQHSTGPKTPDGKQRTSLNALRHGLTSRIVVMPSEDIEAYQRHLESFIAEYQPKGATESHLVQALADTSWRLNRVAALETNVLHQSALATFFESPSKSLANLSIHSQRLSRQFSQTMTQLREIQKVRRAEEQQELNRMLDIKAMCEKAGETFDPSAHGFVFSEPEIQACLQSRKRDRLAAEALPHRRSSAAAAQ